MMMMKDTTWGALGVVRINQDIHYFWQIQRSLYRVLEAFSSV